MQKEVWWTSVVIGHRNGKEKVVERWARALVFSSRPAASAFRSFYCKASKCSRCSNIASGLSKVLKELVWLRNRDLWLKISCAVTLWMQVSLGLYVWKLVCENIHSYRSDQSAWCRNWYLYLSIANKRKTMVVLNRSLWTVQNNHSFPFVVYFSVID